ncbi:glycosyltransferase family 2 protein [Pseudochryseolinea flava]|uniref:Glycosyltransferase family 2 protein n=1 Tax=Pseudochryseolinea flava TaxID=2059302 RepID=A0A364Y3T4_9BACT|nr:glycosyltransferase family 2 protein [Pseudochryseolinea flava]RAW01362.1 glycosyltransferase family 2 protein [Pseudochryseolinea flava]
MVSLAVLIFWVGVAVVLYTYVGYGVVIYIFSKLRGKRQPLPVQADESLPAVTLIIAAYNEELFIDEKLTNTLALDYPKAKLNVWVVTDGSTDRTTEIARNYSGITVHHENQRKGKIHAVNRVMKMVATPIVIFCDANTNLNTDAIKNLVRHYQDPTIGGVAGEKRILSKTEDNASGAGEGIYWKYESFLKKKDAEVHSIVGAAGELFSVRTALYESPEENIIIEDFYISLKIAANGHRFGYEPDAYAIETASASVDEEWKRKVRICAGAFQAMGKLSYLLNPFRYGMLSFQYISHRVLRWTLAPLFLPLILASNIVLAVQGYSIYQMILLMQIAFYALAFAGYLLRDKNIKIKGFFVPYYFMVMNLSVYAGLRRFLKGNQSVVWEKSKRAVA